MRKRNIFGALALALSLSGTAPHAGAQGIDDPRRADYFKVFAGKTIAFIPVTGHRSYRGVGIGPEKAGRRTRHEVRGSRPPFQRRRRRASHYLADLGKAGRPYRSQPRRPVIRAVAEARRGGGIHVIQVNMRSNYNSDAYVGADWIGIGEAETQAVVDRCGTGTSQKVAILEGQPTSGSDSGMRKGADNVFSKHPEIKVV